MSIVSNATSPPDVPSCTLTLSSFGVEKYAPGIVKVLLAPLAEEPSTKPVSSVTPSPVNLNLASVKFCEDADSVNVPFGDGVPPPAGYEIT